MSWSGRNMNEVEGMIINVQHFCLHDGDGIRTTIFFKGCPLHCIWCCNPESQKAQREMACFRHLCQGCMRCISICPQKALSFKGKSIAAILPQCNECGLCVEHCPHEALRFYGRKVSVDYLIEEIRKEKNFYDASGGGVTLSGGEVLQQVEFATALLLACRKEGIHTIVETSAFAPWENLKQVAKVADELYIDIKHMDASLHKMYTGESNELILSNIHRLDEMNTKYVIRIPFLPGINDDENLLDTFIFVRKLRNCKRVGLIPYQKYGISKYTALHRKYLLNSIDIPDDAYLQYFQKLCIEHFHIPCEIGW